MRLIDADGIQIVRARNGKTIIADAIEKLLEQAPTVEAEPVIRCKDCGQREYGCSTFIDHNQLYGFCAWGWKAERKDND